METGSVQRFRKDTISYLKEAKQQLKTKKMPLKILYENPQFDGEG